MTYLFSDYWLSKSEAVEESAPDHILDEINEEVYKLVSTVPKQVQKVWDNLNLRTKHRFERGKESTRQTI